MHPPVDNNGREMVQLYEKGYGKVGWKAIDFGGPSPPLLKKYYFSIKLWRENAKNDGRGESIRDSVRDQGNVPLPVVKYQGTLPIPMASLY